MKKKFIFLALQQILSIIAFDNDSQNKKVYLGEGTRTSLAQCPRRRCDKGFARAAPIFAVPAYLTEFAHMAAIGWTKGDGTIDYNCGGSLISESFILTAAHCGIWQGKAPDVARMGDLNLERDDDDKYAQQIKVEKIIIHPDYIKKFKYHDLALIKLTEPIKLHPVVCPACLWVNSTVKFESVEACGYGQTGFFEKKTPQLLKVKLSPVSLSDCSKHYPPDRKLKDGLIESQLCAVDPEFRQDTCPGDSGGGIQIKLLGYARMNPFIIGVTSFGKSCGTETPGVYTRVSSYVDWIERETGEDFDPLRCSHKYAEFREFEDSKKNKRVKRSEEDRFSTYDTDDFFFSIAYRLNNYHRAKIEPGNCGASFIEENFLLTSASCISKVKPKTAVVLSGNNSFGISQTILHPLYTEGSPNHDIALLKLVEPLVFKDKVVLPACLLTDEISTDELEMMGTGPRGIHSQNVPDLIKMLNETEYQAARSSEIPIAGCREFYRNEDFEITENSICYGNPHWYILPDSCTLDYGGPVGRKLVEHCNHLYYYIFGVNSFGNDCGFGNPVVATKVSNYIEWMDSIIFENKSSLYLKSNVKMSKIFVQKSIESL